MQRLHLTVRDAKGNVLNGAQVFVYDAGTTTAVTIYENNESTTKGNPITTGADGVATAKVPRGSYDVKVVSSAATETIEDIRLIDPDDGLNIYNGTTVTVVNSGDLAIKTNGDGTNITQGVLKYHDGTQEMNVAAFDTFPTTDSDVLAFNSTTNKLEFQTPSAGGSTFESSQQTITAQTTLTLPHGLSSQPKKVWAWLVCQTAQYGWSVGDWVSVPTHHMAGASTIGWGCGIQTDATNVYVTYGFNTNVFIITRKDAGSVGGGATITPANWKFVVLAEA